MGCFLACFGFKKKKKQRKPRGRNPTGEKNHGSYVPLDSDVPNKIQENHISSDAEIKGKPKEPSKLKVKKKVSFNLNVTAYEPIPNEEDISTYNSEGEEEHTKWEFNTENKSLASLQFEEGLNSIGFSFKSYPHNYRYQNCQDSFDDEDDELKFEEDELYIDDVEDSDEVVESDCSNGSDEEFLNQEDFAWRQNHMVKELECDVVTDQVAEEGGSSFEQLLDLQKKEQPGLEKNYHVRDRSRYVFSVLNPVENLTQWKAVKDKAPSMKRQRENVALEEQPLWMKPNVDGSDIRNMPGKNIAVDASLSNWLGSLETKKI